MIQSYQAGLAETLCSIIKMLTEKHIKVLLQIADLLQASGKAVCWGVTGSTSFALQGMNVVPHDIDIQTDEATAYLLGDLLTEYVVRPVTFTGNETIRSHFGQFLVDTMEVEIMGDIQKKTGGKWEEIVPLTSLLDYVSLNDRRIPVLRLSYEAEAYRKLGRLPRAEEIEAFLRKR